MSKWILLLAIAYIGYRFWSRKSASPAASNRRPKAESMLECKQCGVRFPESEAAREEGRVFCCEQHRQSWLRSH